MSEENIKSTAEVKESAPIEKKDVTVDPYLNEQLYKQIAAEQNISVSQVKVTLQLIADGGTVPFIARYRKEVTGALDENQIRAIDQAYQYGQKLAQRKEDIMRLISEKGKLTDELKAAIVQSTKLTELEDIYQPYKEKKKTRATDAKEKGLDPLAQFLLSYPMEADVEGEANKYVSEEKGVKNKEDALQGALDIIAEMVSDITRVRKWIRSYFMKKASLQSTVKDQSLDEMGVYRMYYDYSEPISLIKSHRILALDRGEKEKVLKVAIVEDTDRIFAFIRREIIPMGKEQAATVSYVETAIEDAYKRLLKPSIERDIRNELKDEAEEDAIKIFAENLRSYLLTPPMKGKVVLGIDPAYRTGCKLACIDATGKVLDKGVIYPTPKDPKETVPTDRLIEAERKVFEFCLKYKVEMIAMGNGTASRETEQFTANFINKYKSALQPNISYVIVNEAGASIYSASAIAQEEFPDYHVEERSAVSIARRLQDPLAELVKIDPKSIGVGQYQYDVNQSKLSDSLDFVVSTAVNSVGVNINSASIPLLTRVSGLNGKSAKLFVAYRDEHGAFKNRTQLKIKGIGEKTLEQAIGFLRITDGDEKLDMTSIHPESYDAARLILTKLGFTDESIGSKELESAIKALNRKEFYNNFKDTIGEYTYNDILDSLAAPLRDPRDVIEKPILRQDVLHIEDLKPGMELQGTVRNVTSFGAFVDVGVKIDGLVHVSRMSKGYIKSPLDFVKVNKIVKVWVLSVDVNSKRIELTMIPPKDRINK